MTTKLLVTSVRAFMVAAAALVLVLALAWVGLQLFIVPRIDDYRPQLTALVTRALGAPVTVQRLVPGPGRLVSTVEVHGLLVSDALGRPGLQATRARLQFSLFSLLRGQFRELDLQAPEIWARRDADGSVHVAGVRATVDGDHPGVAAARILLQPHVQLRQGRLHWIDALQQGAPVTLEDIDLVIRGRGRRHDLQLAGQLPSGLGTTVSAKAEYRRSGWLYHAEGWRDWRANVQVALDDVSVAQLATALDLDRRWAVHLEKGAASLQAQAAISAGRLDDFHADVSLQQLVGRLGPDVQPLHVPAFSGRVRWHRQDGSAQVAFEDVRFELAGDAHLHKANGNLWYALEPGGEAEEAESPMRLRLGDIDLQVLGALARHLPLPVVLRKHLQDLHPSGLLDQLDARWSGPLRAPRQWQVHGEVHDLTLAAQPAPAVENDPQPVGVPGASGLALTFDAGPAAGHATVTTQGGSLSFPGIFEEPEIDLDRLLAQMRWQVDGDKVTLDMDKLELANADAEGSFQVHWHNGDDNALGFLDLQGRLVRGNGARVHRYLPLVLPTEARHYVRDAILQGELSDVQVKVSGAVSEIPFNLPGESGTFAIGGQVQDAVMAYVPPALQDGGEALWPPLTQLTGRLEFDGASMRVRQASAEGHADWRFDGIDADLPDLTDPRVAVRAHGSGKLDAALDIVRASPLAELTAHALDEIRADGDAQLQLELDLPVADLLQSTVRGQVQLQHNTVDVGMVVPPLKQAQGVIDFSEVGFTMNAVHARTLGGAVVLSGSMDARRGAAPAHIRASGTASAEGLRQMRAPPLLSALAGRASGSAPYELALTFAARGAQTMQVNSSLEGMALDLPIPFHKAARQHWPLQLQWRRAAAQSSDASAAVAQVKLRLADVLALDWLWPLGRPAAPRGITALGTAGNKLPPLPASGMDLVAEFPELDVDSWNRVGRQLAQAATGSNAPDPADDVWLPHRWRLKVGHLHAAGQTLTQLDASGQREGSRWYGDVQSPELAGHVEYLPGGALRPGRIKARLAHLTVQTPESAAPAPADTVSKLPSMDITAQRFVWNRMDLGQLQLQAEAGDAKRWYIRKLAIVAPEAQLQAHGDAAADTGRTTLDFRLDTDNAGDFLQRLQQPGVMAGGGGTVSGQLGWAGTPLAPDLGSMNGQFTVDVANGSFLKMDAGASRLFGVLSLQALPRRFLLDFSDVFASGFAFDSLHADARLNSGMLATNNLQIKGVNATVDMTGQTDLQKKTQDLHVRVEPRLDAGAGALAAGVINPALGVAAFVAQLALKAPLGRATAREFNVGGSWSEPTVEAVSEVKQEKGTAKGNDAMPAAGENSP